MQFTDLIQMWETTDKAVNPEQFRRNVRSLGIEATDEELDKLFEELDEDGGGTLGLYELKISLMMLRDAQRDFVDAQVGLAANWRAVRTAQARFQSAQLKFEADEAAYEAERQPKPSTTQSSESVPAVDESHV